MKNSNKLKVPSGRFRKYSRGRGTNPDLVSDNFSLSTSENTSFSAENLNEDKKSQVSAFPNYDIYETQNNYEQKHMKEHDRISIAGKQNSASTESLDTKNSNDLIESQVNCCFKSMIDLFLK